MSITRLGTYPQIKGSPYKIPCRVATDLDIVLTGGTPNQVDGINLLSGDRVLVKSQTATTENGIYIVSVLGTGSDGTWVRSVDFSVNDDVFQGAAIFVSEGTIYGGTLFVINTQNPIDLGTSNFSFITAFGGGIGASGLSGLEGSSGVSGIEGTSGLDGTSGISGIEGTSGLSGLEGSSGISGIEGSSGLSGLEGFSGISGVEGSSGISGIVGTSGLSGIVGTSGLSGIVGTSGLSGISGIVGTSGLSGISGIVGTSGLSGISGTSGISGIVGTSGLSGISGIVGTSGISGIVGTSGLSGISGIVGTSGLSGISGIVGTSGISGIVGTSGLSGISGIVGTSGLSGIGFQTISNSSDNRILTSDGTTNAANAEANLTFDGTTLKVTGQTQFINASNNLYFNGTTLNFSGSSNANFLDNLLVRPEIKDYSETYSSPSISSSALTLNLENGNVFNVSLNSDVTTLTITNPPASGKTGSFTLVLMADGTQRTITWGGSIRWGSVGEPTLTSANGRYDIFSFMSLDGGSTWYAFIAGQGY